MNSTAYRIYKILQWLCAESLTSAQLNQRFARDPLVSRTLSEDSLWLYLNTLKKLGCEISRPTPSNGFRYELVYHPFGNLLDEDDIQVLTEAKRLGEDSMTYPEILHLDRFIKKLLSFSSLTEQDLRAKEIFAQSRSVDYENLSTTIEALHQAVQEKQLLFLNYQSPMKGQESFYFLSEELCYKQGVLYFNGSRLGVEHRVMLRVERIVSFEKTNQPAIYEQLLKIQRDKSWVKIRFPGMTAEHFEPLSMGESVDEFERMTVEGTVPFLDVSLETRDFFVLKQKLFERAQPFDVVEPAAFRAEVMEALVTMNRLYQENSGD